ncbi:MAG TPA: sigma-70 family RNA polymerase sigma factor [Bacteroidales bacterium]|nr:sigma-70 family RNA polymerase sigma factor [Bacteroidales bacterium]HPS50739.1 sigma-70 family RNA polymerase sigma factor [Bacteroidales bacterium]
MDSIYVNIHQELIEACSRGDRDAQFKIYKLYYKAMYNTSLRIVNNSAEAEDIMQECFLDAFRRIGSYSGEGSFGSWLKRIVVNRSLDYLRKYKETVSLEMQTLDLPDDNDSGYHEMIHCQVAEVCKAISELPDDYRIILSLFLLEGYDHEEISQILNITNQLSRTRYSRARQKLISVLKEKDRLHSCCNN